LREGFRFCDGYVTLYDAVRSWFDVSADSDFEGADEILVWKNIGYRIIIDILIRSYPDPRKKLDIDGKIHLNKSVQKIIWDADQTITVLTADNSSYSSDYVILTQSVGVLKEQKDTLFDPKLPLSKERAIVDSGYGSIGRIVLKFSTKWWRDDEQLFSFFWGDKDWGIINSSDGPTKNGLSWIVQIREMMKLPGISNVWAIWISGDFLSEIETLPDNILKSGIQYVLNKFLGKTHNVTEIRNILKTTWTTNENFRGTSSYLKTGKYKSDDPVQRRLARPVRNSEGKLKLLFAGEATHSTLYTTVQGAIESGYREAERIIKLCNKSEQ
jgi:spermine oxidase